MRRQINDLKLNDIEIKIPEEMAPDIIPQMESSADLSKDEGNERIVITVNDWDVW